MEILCIVGSFHMKSIQEYQEYSGISKSIRADVATTLQYKNAVEICNGIRIYTYYYIMPGRAFVVAEVVLYHIIQHIYTMGMIKQLFIHVCIIY